MTHYTTGGHWDAVQCARQYTDNDVLFDLLAEYSWPVIGVDERQTLSNRMGNRTPLAIRKRLANITNALTSCVELGQQYQASWYQSENRGQFLQRVNNIRTSAKRVGIVYDHQDVDIGVADILFIEGSMQMVSGWQGGDSEDGAGSNVTFTYAPKKTYKYSEIFHSFQGEGANTGRSTAWIRFFLCNLQCDGFGQLDPTDPTTYILPYKDLDISGIKQIEDLPVFAQGCDSSYTWAKKYRHLAHDNPVTIICDEIQRSMAHPTNAVGLFCHPETHQQTHMAFTGGEPMLNQPAMQEILFEFNKRNNFPKQVTVETNGTKPITPTMLDVISTMYSGNGTIQPTVMDSQAPIDNYSCESNVWFWSVSPKLMSTSGEPESKAIKPEVVAQYANASNYGQLKFVVNGTVGSWVEVDRYVKVFRDAGVLWDVYIMPVGATKESQEEDCIADIAMEAMKRGYHFSGRLHASVFGNQIGT